MISLISVSILLASLIMIGIIAYRKIPVLASLPPQATTEKRIGFAQKIKERISAHPKIQTISLEVYLQKILSKIRVLTMKIEHIIGIWLGSLRQKRIEKKNGLSPSYWDKLNNNHQINPQDPDLKK